MGFLRFFAKISIFKEGSDSEIPGLDPGGKGSDSEISSEIHSKAKSKITIDKIVSDK